MQTVKPTCRKCEHFSPGWCKRYAAVIHQSEPATRCARRGVAPVSVDLAGRQAMRTEMTRSERPAYEGDANRGR